MSGDLLRIESLTKKFGGIQAAHNINYTLCRGEIAAIIGPNGAGKSTVFGLITGAQKPDTGRVWFEGKDITGLPAHEIVNAGVSRAFQVANIFPKMTVEENVRSSLQVRRGHVFSLFGDARRLCAEEAGELIDRCDLSDKRLFEAADLSQGDKKRLELAIALSSAPKLLLLDEPVAGMSREEASQTMDLVSRLNEEMDLTILFTEHNMSIVFGHAQRVLLLHRGEAIIDGSPQEVRDSQVAQDIYFGEQVL